MDRKGYRMKEDEDDDHDGKNVAVICRKRVLN